MATATPDYAALAAKFGGVPAAPAPSTSSAAPVGAATPDYAGLAAKFGGVPAQAAPAPAAPSVGGFLSNAVSSAGNFVSNTAHALRHPIDTVNAVGNVAAGAANEYVPGYADFKKNVMGEKPADIASETAKVEAFKQNIVDRYGSLDKFGHTLYTDPVGTLADLSAVAGGVSGAARGVGAVAEMADAANAASGAARVAKVANAVADVTNPLALAGKAAGAAVDLTKPLIAKAGAVADDARNAGASALDASAEKNIATALNPTTKVNKALVQNKIAPVLAGTKPLLDGGEASATTATSLKDLQETAQANMETHGQAIDDIFDQHAAAGTKLSPKPILAALDKEKQAYTVAGVPINESYVAKIEAFQNQVQKVSDANGGDIPLDDLRRIRQVHDEIVAQSKGGHALPPDAQSAVNASKTFGNAIRSSFAENVPELADANKQFSFWSDVDKVTGDSLLRKTGQRAPLTQKLLGGAGAAIGSHFGPAAAVVGMEAGSKLAALQNSTLWNTLAASTKAKISNLLETGDDAGALALAKQNGVVPATPAAASVSAANVPSSGGTSNAPTTTTANPAVAGTVAGANQEGQAVHAAVQPTGADQSAGAGTVVRVPGQAGAGYQAQYRLRELDDINGSHNGLTFAPNASYKLLNDRNYANPVNQRKVVDWSSRAEFDPTFHVTDNPDATNGPVVTDADGNVIGGNGRAMILQRVYNGNPKGAAAYRDLLAQKASQYGIDPQAVAGMKQPVLTREIPDSQFPGGAAGKQDAVTDFNKGGTAALTPGERAISDSRRVSSGTLDDVAARLDAKGPTATVADVLDGQPGRDVLKKLIADGVVSPQEQASLTTADGLTKAGRERISQLMIGRYFSDPAQLESIPAAARAKVERIAAPLAQVEAKGAWNLTPDVQAAVGLVDEAKKAGIPSIDDYIKQDGLFGKDHYSPNAVTLAKALATTKSTELTAAARRYAQDAAYADKGPSLMGDAPTPKESFDASFGALKSGAQSDAEKFAPKKSQIDAENAREYAAPTLTGQRSEIFATGQSDADLLSKARFDRIPLAGADDQHAVAHVTNLHGIEYIGRMLGEPPDTSIHSLNGTHVSPDQLRTFLNNVAIDAAQTQAPAVAQLRQMAKEAQLSGKSLVFVKDDIAVTNETRATALHEELDHAVQRTVTATSLGGHLGSKASAFVQKPLATIGVQNLKQEFGYSPRSDGVSAAEIGVRLMRPGRYKELGLTLDQARALGRDYVQTLKETHGDAAAREIGKRISEALR